MFFSVCWWAHTHTQIVSSDVSARLTSWRACARAHVCGHLCVCLSVCTRLAWKFEQAAPKVCGGDAYPCCVYPSPHFVAVCLRVAYVVCVCAYRCTPLCPCVRAHKCSHPCACPQMYKAKTSGAIVLGTAPAADVMLFRYATHPWHLIMCSCGISYVPSRPRSTVVTAVDTPIQEKAAPWVWPRAFVGR